MLCCRTSLQNKYTTYTNRCFIKNIKPCHKQLPGEPIASYSHGLIDLADRLLQLERKGAAERDVMLRDQFVENVRDAHLRWDLRRRIEEDAAVGFLALRKVALRWFDEVEGATTSRVKAQVSEVRAEPTDTQREFTKLWGEVAENKKLLTQVLAQQREMLTMCAGAPSSVPATPQRPSAPAPRHGTATWSVTSATRRDSSDAIARWLV